MNKNTLGHVKDFAKSTCQVVGVFVSYVLISKYIPDYIEAQNQSYKRVGYSDAVTAIMESNMWSDDKRKAVSMLKRDKDSDFYKAVIAVANNRSTWSSDKVTIIHDLCKE